MNNDDIRKEIDDLKYNDGLDNDLLRDIVQHINDSEDNDMKDELYGELTSNIYTVLMRELNNNMSTEDFRDKVADYRDILKTSAGLSDNSVDDLFREHGLDIDLEKLGDVVDLNTSNVNDVDDNENVEQEIAELENELKDVLEAAEAANMDPKDFLYDEIKKIEDKKSEDVKSINEEIDKIKKLIEEKAILKDENDLNKEIDKLREEQNEIVQRSGGYPSDEDDKRYHEINKIVDSLEKEISLMALYREKSDDVLNSEKENLKAEQLEIYRRSDGSPSDEDEKRYHEINDIIKTIENELKRRELTAYDKYSDEDLKAQIEKLKAEQLDIYQRSGGYPSDDDEKRYHEINDIIKNFENELKKRKLTAYDKYSDEDIKAEIEKLKAEQLEIYRRSGGSPSDEDEKRYHEINEIIKNFENELNNRKTNNTYKYNSMSVEELKNVLKELEAKCKSVQSKADKEVANLTSKIEKLNRLEELKKKRKTTKKEKRKDLFYKCLAGTAGFALGFGMSMVPGVGTIRMEIAMTKLAVSGVRTVYKAAKPVLDDKILNPIKNSINVWTNKHPTSVVSRIVRNHELRKQNDQKNKEIRKETFKENHPKISAGVDKAREIIRSPYFKWFTNGVAAGYVVGNVVESINTYNNLSKTSGPNVAGNTDGVSKPVTVNNGEVPGPIKPDIPTVPSSYSVGDVLDVSSIQEGYIDSFGNGKTHLLTNLGKKVQIVGESNGMYSLRSLVDGELYAYVPKDAVDALKAGAEIVGKSR